MNGTASSSRGAERASVRRIWSGVRPKYAASPSFNGSKGSAPLPKHRIGMTVNPRRRALSPASAARRDFPTPRFTQDQDHMAFAGFDDSINVLAKQVKLKLPVNQWLLCALAFGLDLLAAAIAPRWHRKPTLRGAPAPEKGRAPSYRRTNVPSPSLAHSGAAEQAGKGTVSGTDQEHSAKTRQQPPAPHPQHH